MVLSLMIASASSSLAAHKVELYGYYTRSNYVFVMRNESNPDKGWVVLREFPSQVDTKLRITEWTTNRSYPPSHTVHAVGATEDVWVSWSERLHGQLPRDASIQFDPDGESRAITVLRPPREE